MSWQARLALSYRFVDGKTVAFSRHEGPLRVLRSLYPEGDAVCHHVIVHPPGGLVGGDTLAIDARLEAGAHALVTTPGATRCYRSNGALARQTSRLRLARGARLEWLPLETLAYPGCAAENAVELDLAEGAEMIGWDVLALGLPAGGAPFERGSFVQHLEWPGRWLERGRIEAKDRRLLDSPLGLDGRCVLACLWFAAGSTLAEPRAAALLAAAREVCAGSDLASHCGASCPHPGLVVVRLVAERVEPAMRILAAMHAAWRARAWALDPAQPRVWRT
jgi:urease accessory protein